MKIRTWQAWYSLSQAAIDGSKWLRAARCVKIARALCSDPAQHKSLNNRYRLAMKFYNEDHAAPIKEFQYENLAEAHARLSGGSVEIENGRFVIVNDEKFLREDGVFV